MSTTQTTTTDTAGTTTGTLVHLDPAQVVVDANVRLDPRLDKAFVASVRERGVLVPVVGHHDDAGVFCVLYGQRRTLAAAQAGLATIPAYVVASQDDADRLVDQMAENDHRAALTTAERATGFAQLAGLGLTAAQIAKRTATKRAEVDTALTVAGSQMAAAAVARFDFLTLDQAATIAEFDADPEAVKALTVAAQQGQFDHVAQRLRDDREQAQAVAVAVAAMKKEGTTFIESFDGYEEHRKAENLSALSVDGKSRKAIEPADHTGCPGHAAYARAGWDWEEDEKGEQYRVAVARVTYVCTDPKAHGHHDRYASTAATSKPKAADLSEKERESAKAERRDVIESNKAWDAAEPVRRAWVKAWLTRKTAPKGSAALIAHAITGDWSTRADVGHHNVPDVARTFGVETTTSGIEKATDGRALVLALGRVLAAFEAQTSRNSWRSVSKHTGLYLTFLAANGYELSPVEKRAAGTKTGPGATPRTTKKDTA